ncbi:hypothetical protein COCSUDRAFT_60057 [Coccomyxa subellipsoidea C-169]|uniref:Uncharacterized protein n=1 Tax=Coccomyxa subellipsoidea (strain C-169) TaxID=574566 RepID=I0YK33_COCSC|nr:hypothetical protein COCSUDRAFT_60057 [Coccomyxa subellipsoidea C-169]EIE18752.1 hypothetical protein COCSUDRAFT_60057 [Coccomyxa subellipsoidea C-169]|eukprot:XP_005643296.1 hypothetical protein COCSUDRAFT_60057 [Coccomyxa subellipsoidea C-169]
MPTHTGGNITQRSTSPQSLRLRLQAHCKDGQSAPMPAAHFPAINRPQAGTPQQPAGAALEPRAAPGGKEPAALGGTKDGARQKPAPTQ